MKTAAALILALALLSGCSSFRLGAFCYLPAGNAATCSMQQVPATGSAGAPS